jgi:hypothetical protein
VRGAVLVLALAGCTSINVPLATQIEAGVGAGTAATAVAVGAPWWAACAASGAVAAYRAQDAMIDRRDAALGAAVGCITALAIDRLRLWVSDWR